MYKGFIGDYPVKKLASYTHAIDRASTVLYVWQLFHKSIYLAQTDYPWNETYFSRKAIAKISNPITSKHYLPYW